MSLTAVGEAAETPGAAEPTARTLLRLDHTAPVPPQMWTEFGPGAVGIGWEMMLMGLAEHLVAPEAERPDVPTDLTEMLVGAGDGWVGVSIVGGTDPAEVRAAGTRCAAAYTGSDGAGDAA